MKIDILVDSDKFFDALKNDIQNAKRNIYIQAMTFEADRAGNQLCDLLKVSQVKDIRILVDSYIKAMISDQFLYSPANILNRSLKNEFKETINLINQLNNLGIKVKFTNHLGPLLIHFVSRNHKKLVIIDNKISYIGGINFSDHNFLWHDMMVRIEHQNIAKFLREDFLATWSGKNQCCTKDFESLALIIFDGKSNDEAFELIFKMIDQAKKTILIESPYLTFPFYQKLRQAAERGVKTSLICPEDNNISLIHKYTLWEVQRSGITLRLLRNMTHLKAMLIDDEFLVIGSSNFDYLSYSSYQEIIAIIRDYETVNSFKKQVFQKDWSRSFTWTGKTSSSLGFIRYIVLKAVCAFALQLFRLSNKWKFKLYK